MTSYRRVIEKERRSAFMLGFLAGLGLAAVMALGNMLIQVVFGA